MPLRAIAEGSGLLNEELALLNNAEDASNELAVIENEIMAVIASGPGVVDLANPPEGETLQAIQRLHSQEYHGAKAVIMSNLAELGRNVMATFGEVRQRLIELSTSSLSGNTILVGLTMVVVAADLWFQVRRRGLRQAFGSRATGFSLLASLLACLLVLLSLTLFTYFLREQPGVSRAISARVAARSFSDSLRQTSDDLTRMARLYTVTGEARYREYFTEILDIRNGIEARPAGYFDLPYWDIVLDTGERPGAAGQPVAIRTLANNAGLSPAELAEFHKAEDASNALAVIENEIMEVVAAQIEAGDGDYVLEGEALDAMLRLHGPDYFAAKAQVMIHLVELGRKVDESFGELRPQVISFYDQGLRNGVILLAATLVLVAVEFLVNRRSLPAAGRARPLAILAALLAFVAVLFSLTSVRVSSVKGRRSVATSRRVWPRAALPTISGRLQMT